MICNHEKSTERLGTFAPAPPWSEYLDWREAFADILDERYYTIDWVDEAFADGRLHLFTGEKSAILVSVKEYPTGAKELHGMLAAGELNQIRSTIAIAENWGRSIGCVSAVIESRAGWMKVMREDGYQLYQTAIRKDLTAVSC